MSCEPNEESSINLQRVAKRINEYETSRKKTKDETIGCIEFLVGTVICARQLFGDNTVLPHYESHMVNLTSVFRVRTHNRIYICIHQTPHNSRDRSRAAHVREQPIVSRAAHLESSCRPPCLRQTILDGDASSSAVTLAAAQQSDAGSTRDTAMSMSTHYPQISTGLA